MNTLSIPKIVKYLGFALLIYAFYEWYVLYGMHHDFFKDYKDGDVMTDEIKSHIAIYKDASGVDIVQTFFALSMIVFGLVW